jgi:hypothetical protein
MNRCHGLSFYNIISNLLVNHHDSLLCLHCSTAAIVHKKALSDLPSITQNSNMNSECI